MPTQLKYTDLGEIMGSWPTIPQFFTGTPILQPEVVDAKARLLGVVREPTAGYDVGGRQFFLVVDGTQHTITFTSTLLTLQQVMDVLNEVGGAPGSITPSVGFDIAFRDNGFLRLESNDSLEPKTDPSSTPTNVLFNLGLFPETVGLRGGLTPTPHLDPNRQIMLPGQLSMGEGENLEARVINRLAYQLATNVDRQEGLLSKKRIGISQTHVEGSYSSSTPEGVTIVDNVYVGSTTGAANLEDRFVVLDDNDDEFVVTTDKSLGGHTAANIDIKDGVGTITNFSGTASFAASDVSDAVYVKIDTGIAAPWLGAPLKITEYISVTSARCVVLDPATGDLAPDQTLTSETINKHAIDERRVRVDGVFDGVGGSPIEGVQESVLASIVPTRVDLNNRIVCVGSDFTAAGVAVGDLVDWTGHVASLFDNVNVFRVAEIVDKETLKLADLDWGPVLLQNDLSTPGSIDITTDGAFYNNPFVRFAALEGIPPVGSSFRVQYLGMSNLRTASDDPTFLSGGLKFTQETDADTTKAVLRLAGPSYSSITDILYGDRRNNVEDAYHRLNREHHTHDSGADGEAGRHSDINPDTIDMFPDVVGTTVTVRAATGEVAATKVQLLDNSGFAAFKVDAVGRVFVDVDTGNLILGADAATFLGSAGSGSATPGGSGVLGTGGANITSGGIRLAGNGLNGVGGLAAGATTDIPGAGVLGTGGVHSNRAHGGHGLSGIAGSGTSYAGIAVKGTGPGTGVSAAPAVGGWFEGGAAATPSQSLVGWRGVGVVAFGRSSSVGDSIGWANHGIVSEGGHNVAGLSGGPGYGGQFTGGDEDLSFEVAGSGLLVFGGDSLATSSGGIGGIGIDVRGGATLHDNSGLAGNGIEAQGGAISGTTNNSPGSIGVFGRGGATRATTSTGKGGLGVHGEGFHTLVQDGDGGTGVRGVGGNARTAGSADGGEGVVGEGGVGSTSGTGGIGVDATGGASTGGTPGRGVFATGGEELGIGTGGIGTVGVGGPGGATNVGADGAQFVGTGQSLPSAAGRGVYGKGSTKSLGGVGGEFWGTQGREGVQGNSDTGHGIIAKGNADRPGLLISGSQLPGVHPTTPSAGSVGLIDSYAAEFRERVAVYDGGNWEYLSKIRLRYGDLGANITGTTTETIFEDSGNTDVVATVGGGTLRVGTRIRVRCMGWITPNLIGQDVNIKIRLGGTGIGGFVIAEHIMDNLDSSSIHTWFVDFEGTITADGDPIQIARGSFAKVQSNSSTAVGAALPMALSSEVTSAGGFDTANDMDIVVTAQLSDTGMTARMNYAVVEID